MGEHKKALEDCEKYLNSGGAKRDGCEAEVIQTIEEVRKLI